MIDMNAIRQEMDRLSGRSRDGYKSSGGRSTEWMNSSTQSNRPHRQRKTDCPCGEEVNAFTVMKDGPNNGRLFAHCNKCDRFQWLDCPLCKVCGERKYKAMAKKRGKNYGKWFQSCPSQCDGSFHWLGGDGSTELHGRGGWYEIV